MKGVGVCLLVSLMLVLLAIKDTESKKMNLEELKKSIKNLRKPCSKKNDTPKELLDGQHNGEFPKDEKLMCYMKCVLTQTKAMKGDEIMWDFFVKNARVMILDEYFPRITHLVETCKNAVTATDGCEAAWQFSTCTYATDSELYIIP
ncbi:odorant binding protein 6 [Bombus fervidus]|uniref:odorant binding protein 6 n=1 Tax=Bombus fervidus TaxID=203811 RepID=UPI003AB4491E